MAENQHILMLPWLAFGHLLPFLQLSTALAKSGFKISFLSTPKNLRRLPTPPPNVSANIAFVSVPLPHVDGLQEGAEATIDLPTSNDELLKKAYDLLRHPLESFVAEHSPDWIVHDVLSHWAPEVGRQRGVPSVAFSVYPASTLAFIVADLLKLTPSSLALTVPPWLPATSHICFLPYEAKWLVEIGLSTNASGVSDCERCFMAIQRSTAIAVRASPEYESEYLDCLLRNHSKPIISTGLLPPEARQPFAATDSGAASGGGEWADVFRWLDGKPPKSVVFVGFGSECKLSQEEVHELARGLELSGLGFLWALREPDWAKPGSDVFPPGFLARVAGRGVVTTGWAPQMEILGHAAIGGLLFHAGWGTTIEAVQFGHALVGLPFADGQGLCARLGVEKGVVLEVERDGDGAFRGEAVAKALKEAMVGQGSRKWMAHFGDQELHQRYLNGFVDFLNNYKIANV